MNVEGVAPIRPDITIPPIQPVRRVERGSERADGPAVRPVTILIIIADATLRARVSSVLRGTGLTVVAAADGAAGAARAAAVVPDLIVVDDALPDLDGAQVCLRLRRDERTARTPIIMLVAVGADRPAAADRHAAKPVRAGELRGQVRALLGGTGRRLSSW